jgi:hypothetical protein
MPLKLARDDDIDEEGRWWGPKRSDSRTLVDHKKYEIWRRIKNERRKPS